MELYIAAAVTLVAVVGAYTVHSVLKKSKIRAQIEAADREKEQLRKEAERKKAEEESKKVKCSIYFGSQTGTAEGFAKETAKAISRLGYAGKVVDLEDFDPEELGNTKLALFYCATYGEGDAPDNALEFCSWLKDEKCSLDKAEEGCLSGLEFAVFGLGNTQYEHYNAMGKLIQKRLAELSGKPMYQYGEGDDDRDIEEDFETWHEGLLEVLAKRTGGNPAQGEKSERETDSSESSPYEYTTIVPPNQENLLEREGRYSALEKKYTDLKSIDFSCRHFFEAVPAVVEVNRELRQSAGENGRGSTLHVELALDETGMTYDTADNLAICPENEPELVKQAANFLEIDLDEWFVLRPRDANVGPLFPTPCTIRTALTCYISLNHIPSRHTLVELSNFATSQEHKKRLQHLGSKDGKDEYHKRIVERRHDLVDVLEMFPSIKFDKREGRGAGTRSSLGAFFEAMPKLQPRYYTISSSSKAHPERIHITASVVTEPKSGPPEGRVFHGVCTTFLSRLRLNQPEHSTPRAYVYVRTSTFKLPKQTELPVVLIGPGTGVAPMRAFLQERALQDATARGDTVLFFGCRREDEDFIYKEEFEKAVKDGVLTKLVTAFSRAQEHKVYVQHMIEKESKMIWDYIDSKNGSIYVCGGTQMGKDVQVALEAIIAQEKSVTSDEAKAYIEALQREKRYIQELWSS